MADEIQGLDPGLLEPRKIKGLDPGLLELGKIKVLDPGLLTPVTTNYLKDF
jgi:hypothetical protein